MFLLVVHQRAGTGVALPACSISKVAGVTELTVVSSRVALTVVCCRSLHRSNRWRRFAHLRVEMAELISSWVDSTFMTCILGGINFLGIITSAFWSLHSTCGIPSFFRVSTVEPQLGQWNEVVAYSRGRVAGAGVAVAPAGLADGAAAGLALGEVAGTAQLTGVARVTWACTTIT